MTHFLASVAGSSRGLMPQAPLCSLLSGRCSCSTHPSIRHASHCPLTFLTCLLHSYSQLKMRSIGTLGGNMSILQDNFTPQYLLTIPGPPPRFFDPQLKRTGLSDTNMTFSAVIPSRHLQAVHSRVIGAFRLLPVLENLSIGQTVDFHT